MFFVFLSCVSDVKYLSSCGNSDASWYNKMSATVLGRALNVTIFQAPNVLFDLQVELINHLLFCPFGSLRVLCIQILNTILWLSPRPPSSSNVLLRASLRYILAIAQPGQLLSTKQLHFFGPERASQFRFIPPLLLFQPSAPVLCLIHHRNVQP